MDHINWHDFKQNCAIIRREQFIEPPVASDDQVEFIVENHYQADGRLLCIEYVRHRIVRVSAGYHFDVDSRCLAVEDLRYGDQEEMGLGVAVGDANHSSQRERPLSKISNS